MHVLWLINHLLIWLAELLWLTFLQPSSSYLCWWQLLQVSVQPKRGVFKRCLRSVPGDDWREDLSIDTTSLYQIVSFLRMSKDSSGIRNTDFLEMTVTQTYGGETKINSKYLLKTFLWTHREMTEKLWPQKTHSVEWPEGKLNFSKGQHFLNCLPLDFLSFGCPWLGSESKSLCNPLTKPNVMPL